MKRQHVVSIVCKTKNTSCYEKVIKNYDLCDGDRFLWK